MCIFREQCDKETSVTEHVGHSSLSTGIIMETELKTFEGHPTLILLYVCATYFEKLSKKLTGFFCRLVYPNAIRNAKCFLLLTNKIKPIKYTQIFLFRDVLRINMNAENIRERRKEKNVCSNVRFV